MLRNKIVKNLKSLRQFLINLLTFAKQYGIANIEVPIIEFASV